MAPTVIQRSSSGVLEFRPGEGRRSAAGRRGHQGCASVLASPGSCRTRYSIRLTKGCCKPPFLGVVPVGLHGFAWAKKHVSSLGLPVWPAAAQSTQAPSALPGGPRVPSQSGGTSGSVKTIKSTARDWDPAAGARRGPRFLAGAAVGEASASSPHGPTDRPQPKMHGWLSTPLLAPG
jgi:hypothetical protein